MKEQYRGAKAQMRAEDPDRFLDECLYTGCNRKTAGFMLYGVKDKMESFWYSCQWHVDHNIAPYHVNTKRGNATWWEWHPIEDWHPRAIELKVIIDGKRS